MNREEAIKILKDTLYDEKTPTDYLEAVRMGREALENQKTGHWIRWYEEVEHKTCTENIPHCKCSECNKEYNPYSSFFIKYCSQCGAKMEGENNE